MIYIIDTYAWVEYLRGSVPGRRVKEIIESEEKVITPECCLAELKGWCLREKCDFDDVYLVVRSNTNIEPVFTEDWLLAAEVKHEKRKHVPDFGLIDGIIVSKQRKYGAKVLSGNPHFKHVKNTEYIGQE